MEAGPVTRAGDGLVGAVVDGRYAVVSRIARGGMATVYLATDTRLDRDVALKVMHGHLADDPEFVSRFHREAVSAARMSHPGVVAVYDQGRDDGLVPGSGVVYLVMEHVPGSTLRDLLAAEGALSVGVALAVLEPVLDALAAAHRAGVVHRDVKPENVLLTDDGRVKVADFGLARAASSQTTSGTSTGMLMGTVAYLSPELVLRGVADARSDVYAAGITLFEMLTGAQPFTGEVPIQVAYQHVHDDVPAPSTLVASVPPELDDLVLWMTARDPDERPVDARELVHEVRALRGDLADAVQDAAPRPADAAPLPGAAAGQVHPTLSVQHEHARVLPVGEPADGAPGRGGSRAGSCGPALVGARPAGAGRTGGGGGVPPRQDTAVLSRPAGDAAGHPAVLPSGAGPSGAAPVRRRRRRGLITALVLLLVAAAAVGGVAWYLLAGPGAYSPAPQTAGQSLAAAEQTLTDAGLSSTTSERYDELTPAGTVIESRPAAGEDVRDAGTVELFVSRGSEFSLVPDLAGATEDDARTALEDVELELSTGEPDYDDLVPEGAVVSQDPAPGQELRRGEGVDVVLSLGREPLDVPDVTGSSREDAVATVTDAGLDAVVQEEYSEDVEAGDVVSQSPADGTLFAGDDVTLVVSLGPPLVQVPDVVGQQLEDARAQLEGAGLVVEEESVLGGFFGTVREQDVSPGTEVAQGSTVVLTVV